MCLSFPQKSVSRRLSKIKFKQEVPPGLQGAASASSSADGTAQVIRTLCNACRRSNKFKDPRSNSFLVLRTGKDANDETIYYCVLCESAAAALFITITQLILKCKEDGSELVTTASKVVL